MTSPLLELDGADPPGVGRAPGLAHVAFDVGSSLAELRDARATLVAAGVGIQREESHGSARSLFVLDPDANEVELFVDLTTAGPCAPEQGS